MLLSFNKRFFFIANTKTASTTIERNLRRHADISICATRMGKHMSYAQAVKYFQFMFRKSGMPAEAYFRFGVVREPVEWVVSWYNYRHRDQMLKKVDKKKKSTQGIDFDQFAADLLKAEKKTKGQKVPTSIGNQINRFTAKDGSLGVDYLIPLSRIETDLRLIAEELGIKRALTPDKEHANVSPKIISAKDVNPELAQQLRTHFADDLLLFNKAQENGFGDIPSIIKAKKDFVLPA